MNDKAVDIIERAISLGEETLCDLRKSYEENTKLQAENKQLKEEIKQAKKDAKTAYGAFLK